MLFLNSCALVGLPDSIPMCASTPVGRTEMPILYLVEICAAAVMAPFTMPCSRNSCSMLRSGDPMSLRGSPNCWN